MREKRERESAGVWVWVFEQFCSPARVCVSACVCVHADCVYLCVVWVQKYVCSKKTRPFFLALFTHLRDSVGAWVRVRTGSSPLESCSRAKVLPFTVAVAVLFFALDTRV